MLPEQLASHLEENERKPILSAYYISKLQKDKIFKFKTEDKISHNIQSKFYLA